MDTLPEITGRDEWAALIVRTDYTDDAAWRAVVAESQQPQADDYEPRVHLVDDPAWAGAAPERIRAAAERDEYLSVVFVADALTMTSAAHALLALDLGEEEEKPEDLDPVYYADLIQQLVESPAAREFRTTPAALHDVFANLQLANLDFDDFAQEAAADPDGILRPV